MRSYQIDSPPPTSGIYLLRNRVAKIYYVGQAKSLRQRWADWRSSFNTTAGYRNARFHDVIKNTDIADWEFVVIEEMPAERLDRREGHAIEIMRREVGDNLLNRLEDVTRIRLVDDHGVSMTQREAAKVIGCTVRGLAKRLNKRKHRYPTTREYRVSDLKAETARYLKFYNATRPTVPT